METKAVTNKAFIEGRIYDVFDQFDYGMYNYTGNALALKVGPYVLPVRIGQVIKPGVYLNGYGFYSIVYPRTPEEEETYSASHLAYFESANTFMEVVAEKEKLEKDEFNHLVNSSNVFAPVIDQMNDSPLILGLKMAVTEKQCDINSYAEKFGNDFNNDRRKFNGHDITAAKYASISNNLDIRTTLIIEDMHGEVANPMGKRIILTWVGDGEHDQDYESFYRNAIPNIEVNDNLEWEEF